LRYMRTLTGPFPATLFEDVPSVGVVIEPVLT
jgi:hypothetical protein